MEKIKFIIVLIITIIILLTYYIRNPISEISTMDNSICVYVTRTYYLYKVLPNKYICLEIKKISSDNGVDYHKHLSLINSKAAFKELFHYYYSENLFSRLTNCIYKHNELNSIEELEQHLFK